MKEKINGGVKLLLFLAALGFSIPFLFQIWGEVDLKFVGKAGNGYEFELYNNSILSKRVEKLRVNPALKQQIVFSFTKDVYAKITPNGFELPGGNTPYVPAAEFTEIDNIELTGTSGVKFRIPALTSNPGMKVEAMIIYVDYQVRSFSSITPLIGNVLGIKELGLSICKKKFLVTDDYWLPTDVDQPVDALKVACRDTEWFGKSISCRKYR